MKKSVLLLLATLMSGSVLATTYQPNSSSFSCPDDEIVDSSKSVEISVGERPGGIGECFWRDPVVSFGLTQDRSTLTAYTTWTLDGGFLADGCSNIKGEKITSIGIISKMQCKTQQL